MEAKKQQSRVVKAAKTDVEKSKRPLFMHLLLNVVAVTNSHEVCVESQAANVKGLTKQYSDQ